MHDEPRIATAAPLRISLFAGLAEAAGCRVVELPWSGGSVAELRAAVATRLSARNADVLARSAVVVDGRHADDRTTVPHGSDVAILPPVSGG